MKKLWKNKSFLFLFLGRLVTNIGDSLYYIAAMWLVYDLSKNPFYSGLAGFLTLLPMTLQFAVGPLIDRWPIKRTIVITQVLQMIIILVIPITYFFDVLTVALILVIMPVSAFIEQFTYPSQSKALPLIIEKEHLVKGNGLFSFAYQGVDMLFNAIGGILVYLIGPITMFLADSITFAIATMLFSLVTIPQKHSLLSQQETKLRYSFKQYRDELKEGFSIVFHSLLSVFLLGAVVCNFAIGISMAVLPSYSNDKGGVEIYGFLLAAQSTGVLIGALLSSKLEQFRVGLSAIVMFAIGFTSWFLSAIIPSSMLAISLYGLAWIPIGAINVLFGAINQSIIPNSMYGRISSVTYSLSAIAMPFGSLLGGYLAEIFNSSIVFACSSCGFIMISIVWLLHPKLRKLPTVKEMKPETFLITVNKMNNTSLPMK